VEHRQIAYVGQREGTAVPGASCAFSQRPFSHASQPFIASNLKVAFVSIWPIRQAVGEWALFAHPDGPLLRVRTAESRNPSTAQASN
jgi:hypothetical protein